METGRHKVVIAVLTHVYRLFLYCYPKEFRNSFGTEMVDVFERRCHAACDRGFAKLMHVSIVGFLDLFATASAEHADIAPGRPPTARTLIEGALLDARYAVRTLAKRPAFSLLVVLSLTLAIGSTTAVFSLVNGAILRPLPFTEPNRLVTLWELLPQGASFGAMAGIGVAPANYSDWKAQNQIFSEMALIGASTPTLKTADGAHQLQAERVSEEFFDILGLRPQVGRTFHRDDYLGPAPQVAIISQKFWQGFLGARADALGRTFQLDDRVVTVVGIMPGDLNLPSLWGRTNEKPDLWIPLRLTNEELVSRRYYAFRPIARLKSDVTIQRADAEMAVIAKRLSAQYPETNAGMGIGVVALDDQLLRDFRAPLLILLAATILVLLIACVNVANLLLVRANARRREFAIRGAVGATRGGIIRQSLIESFILALVASVCGTLAAHWTIPIVLSSVPPDNLMPRLEQVPTDFRTVGFAILLSVLTAVLFGVAPAVSALRTHVSESLQEGGRAVGQRRQGHRLANILVTLEVALAFVLVVAAGVLLQSFRHLNRINPGFRAAGLVALDISVPEYKHQEKKARFDLYAEILRRARSLPGIQSTAVASGFPDAYIVNCLLEGHPIESRSRVPQVVFRSISPGFFETLGLPLHAGREFTERDTSDTPLVAVISERMAHGLWRDENPLGKRFRQDNGDQWRTVIGIVRDINRKTTDRLLPEYYVPYTQVPPPSGMKLIARTEGDPISMAPFLRSSIRSYDPDIPIGNVAAVEGLLDKDVWKQKLSSLLMSFFAGIAILLAAAGIYGIMSNAVAQRTNEMGVRLALGAKPTEVTRMVIGQGLRLATSGVVIGLVSLLGITRALASFLYGFTVPDANRIALARQIDQPSGILYGASATDPVMLTAISLLLIALALVACYLPARRATRIDPLQALRTE
jgi:putative ABC transport system permease protein